MWEEHFFFTHAVFPGHLFPSRLRRTGTRPAFKRNQRLFTSRISCPRPPTLRSSRQGQNSLQFVRLYGKPRERQAHSIAFYLKDTSKHLSCVIRAVGEVQRSLLRLPHGVLGLRATPPSLYRADPASNRGPAFICYTALNTPGV